jgi:hypothetical protein
VEKDQGLGKLGAKRFAHFRPWRDVRAIHYPGRVRLEVAREDFGVGETSRRPFDGVNHFALEVLDCLLRHSNAYKPKDYSTVEQDCRWSDPCLPTGDLLLSNLNRGGKLLFRPMGVRCLDPKSDGRANRSLRPRIREYHSEFCGWKVGHRECC